MCEIRKKSTTPESAIVALESFLQPKIIIAGGYDKKISFDELGRKIADSAKAAVLFGQTAGKIKEAILAANPKSKVSIVKSLGEAVSIAQGIATMGDVVILSPGCASYDMFENYQQRGDIFSQLARQLLIQ